jgi:uncharacterized membrane protein
MSERAGLATLLQNRWRTLFAGVVGVSAGWLAHRHGLLDGASTLVGWDAAAAAFVLPTGWLLLTSDEAAVRARAKLEDEDRTVLMSIVLAAVAVSLAAIVLALKETKLKGAAGPPSWVIGLSVATLVLSWLVVQCLYALHYAHRYFGDADDDGQEDGGIEFPGAKPTTYKDFVYVAVCVGATCQVSDFDIVTARFRNLVTTHALISFVFNTMVLALGINIIGNLMGQ